MRQRVFKVDVQRYRREVEKTVRLKERPHELRAAVNTLARRLRSAALSAFQFAVNDHHLVGRAFLIAADKDHKHDEQQHYRHDDCRDKSGYPAFYGK